MIKPQMKVKFFFMLLIISVIASQNIYSQSLLECTVDGDKFSGKIEDAVMVTMGNEEFIQIKSNDSDKILYLYIKSSKLKGEMPITLKYKDHDQAKGEMADAEIIWVPEGPDNPQWNSVDGELVVSQFDALSKTISAAFEFKVEKFEYSSKASDDRPSVDIENGKIEALKYRVEEKKEGS